MQKILQIDAKAAADLHHFAQTCNTWTNSRLKESGLPAVQWTPFAKPLIEYHQ